MIAERSSRGWSVESRESKRGGWGDGCGAIMREGGSECGIGKRDPRGPKYDACPSRTVADRVSPGEYRRNRLWSMMPLGRMLASLKGRL